MVNKQAIGYLRNIRARHKGEDKAMAGVIDGYYELIAAQTKRRIHLVTLARDTAEQKGNIVPGHS